MRSLSTFGSGYDASVTNKYSTSGRIKRLGTRRADWRPSAKSSERIDYRLTFTLIFFANFSSSPYFSLLLFGCSKIAKCQTRRQCLKSIGGVFISLCFTLTSHVLALPRPIVIVTPLRPNVLILTLSVSHQSSLAFTVTILVAVATINSTFVGGL